MWWVPVMTVYFAGGLAPVKLEHSSYYFSYEQCMQRAEVLATEYVQKHALLGSEINQAVYDCKPLAQVS